MYHGITVVHTHTYIRLLLHSTISFHSPITPRHLLQVRLRPLPLLFPFTHPSPYQTSMSTASPLSFHSPLTNQTSTSTASPISFHPPHTYNSPSLLLLLGKLGIARIFHCLVSLLSLIMSLTIFKAAAGVRLRDK